MSRAFCALRSFPTSSWTFCPCARSSAFCSPRLLLASSPSPRSSASRSFSPADSCLRSSDLSRRTFWPRRLTSAPKGNEDFLGSKTNRPTSTPPSTAPAAGSAEPSRRRGCFQDCSRAASAAAWTFSCASRASRTALALALSTSDWRLRRSSRSSASRLSSFWCSSSRVLGCASSPSSLAALEGAAAPARPSFRLLPVREEPAPLLPPCAAWRASSEFLPSIMAACTSNVEVVFACAGSKTFKFSCTNVWS
mmetsp:Transcript_48417/g.149585  ORF Transcript_48417/g.149585 Transcript_48417/m.149585 type:complete len:251 (+) Transcript_48417:299-1051(+)